MKVVRETLIWSFPAHVFFGLCNFLIGYSNTLDVDRWAVVGVLWFSSGLVGLLPAAFFYGQTGSLFFADAALVDESAPASSPSTSPRITLSVKLATIAGGLCVGISQLLMKQSFAMAPVLTGPLCAVISSDTLVVSTVCHFVYKERLSLRQALAILVIVAGLGVMAIFAQSGDSSSGSASAHAALPAFGLSFLGMLLFASAVLTIRTGCVAGLSAWSGFVVRMLTLLLLGLLTFAYSVLTVGLPRATWGTWLSPVAAGIAQSIGVFTVNKALQQPNTGIANAIFASNSVLVLVLNMVVFGLLPSFPSLVGMALVVLGVVGISLLEGDAPQDLTPHGSVVLPRTLSAYDCVTPCATNRPACSARVVC